MPMTLSVAEFPQMLAAAALLAMPFGVTLASARRTILSHSLNRPVYALACLVAAQITLHLLARTLGGHPAGAAEVALAAAIVPVWLVLRATSRSSRTGRYRRPASRRREPATAV